MTTPLLVLGVRLCDIAVVVVVSFSFVADCCLHDISNDANF